MFLTVLLLLCALCSAASAWIVNHVPLVLDTLNEPKFRDAKGVKTIPKGKVGCEIIEREIGGVAGLPFNHSRWTDDSIIYLTVLTDLEHTDPEVGLGCTNCIDSQYSVHNNQSLAAQSCCVRRAQSRWTFVDRVGLIGDAHGETYCVPKGYRAPNDNDCSSEYVYTGLDDIGQVSDTVNRCQNVCLNCDKSSSCKEAEGCVLNRGNAPGDCLYSHEILFTNVRPTECRAQAFDVGAFDEFGDEAEVQRNFLVTVKGSDDAAIGAGGLQIWTRSRPNVCTDWIANREKKEKVEIVKACGGAAVNDWHFHHAIASLDLDDVHPVSAEGGVGGLCSGHQGESGATCSPKAFIGDQSNQGYRTNFCRTHGCMPAGSDATATHTCHSGDLLLSTNFEFTGQIHDAGRDCSGVLQNEYHVLFEATATTAQIQALKDSGKPQDIANDDPDFCCDMSHHGAVFENETSGADIDTRGGQKTSFTPGEECKLLADGTALFADACGVCGGVAKTCGASTLAASPILLAAAAGAVFAALAL